MQFLNTLRTITTHPLNRKRKLRAVLDFAKWQIGSRLARGPMIYEWAGQSKLLIHRGEAALTANLYTGLFEFEDMGFLLHFLRPEDLFVDVGANLGSFTILASAVVGAPSIAIEPVPSTYARLTENIALNSLHNVMCINMGAGSEPGVLQFTTDTDSMNHVVRVGENPKHTIGVHTDTLDNMLSGKTPAIIKIDVEGFEAAVINGAVQTLATPGLKAVVMELCGGSRRYGFDESEILSKMLKIGFAPHSYDPFTRNLTRVTNAGAHGLNTLFIRDPAFVSHRIKTAKPFSVHGHRI